MKSPHCFLALKFGMWEEIEVLHVSICNYPDNDFKFINDIVNLETSKGTNDKGSLLLLYGPSEYPCGQKHQGLSSLFPMTLRITMLPSHCEGFSRSHHPFSRTGFYVWAVSFFHTVQNTRNFLCKPKSVCF